MTSASTARLSLNLARESIASCLTMLARERMGICFLERLDERVDGRGVAELAERGGGDRGASTVSSEYSSASIRSGTRACRRSGDGLQRPGSFSSLYRSMSGGTAGLSSASPASAAPPCARADRLSFLIQVLGSCGSCTQPATRPSSFARAMSAAHRRLRPLLADSKRAPEGYPSGALNSTTPTATTPPPLAFGLTAKFTFL